MTVRTIGEARSALDDLLPTLNDHQTGQYRQLLDAHESRARQSADRHVADREEEALAIRQNALQALTEARDACDAIAAEAQTGRTPASDLSKQLADARRQQEAAEAALVRAEALAASIAEIEEDPVAWASRMEDRIPRLQRDYPW